MTNYFQGVIYIMKKHKIIIIFIFFIMLLSPNLFMAKGITNDTIYYNQLSTKLQYKCAFSNIGNDVDNQVFTPTFDLSSVSDVELTFYIQHYLHGTDSCYVHIKVDDGAWNDIAQYTGIQNDWAKKSYDLSSTAGHEIRLRFRYHTGLTSTSEGAYIDLINITGDGNTIYGEDFESYEIDDPWGDWTIIEKSPPNDPPDIPRDPFPANDSTNVNVNVDISWTGGDPDPDNTVRYDIYFGIEKNPINIETDYLNTSFDPGRLEYNTQYYWRIDAWDNYDNSTTGPIWTFKTAENNPPFQPNNPSPANGSTYVNIQTNLSWMGGDPDDDIVVYDIYFGTDSNPPSVLIDYLNTTYDPGLLEYNTQYYWRVDAWDSFDNSTTGEIWSFKTTLTGNNPPFKPDKPSGPGSGIPLISYSYNTTSIDPDLDKIYYMFDWDDGTNSGWIDPFNCGQTISSSHVWNNRGTFQIKVKCKDDNGLESVWSDPLSISMPKNKSLHFIILRIFEKYPEIIQFLNDIMILN